MGKLVPQIRFKGTFDENGNWVAFTNDWAEKKLGEVCTSYSGGTPSASIKEYYGGTIPFIRSAEINSNTTELFITQKGYDNSSAKYVEIGDILYASYGATSGEVGRSKIKGAINQAILALKPIGNIDKEYLVHWLRKSKQYIISTYLQGGQGNLSAEIIKNLTLNFPSIFEQQKIGTYFQTLDTLIEKTSKELEGYKKLKKAMLQKMFV